MAAFAQPADLALFVDDDTLDGPRGQMMVDQASAAIRTYCRQTFDRVADDAVELRGSWSDRLKLPERPVVDVTTVAVDGVEVDDWRRVRDVLFRGRLSSYAKSSGHHWGGPDVVVTVTYTHGFAPEAPALETLKGVCLQLASRAAINPRSQTSESIGDWSASWSDGAGGFSLTAAEQAILDRFRTEWAS